MKNSARYVIFGLIIATFGIIWLPVPFPLQLVAAVLILFFWPGWLLVQAIGFKTKNRVEQIIIASGLSFGLSVLSLLVTLYVAGHLSKLLIVLELGSISLIFILMAHRRSAQVLIQQTLAFRDAIYFLIPIGVALLFSFTNLGYSDYWGDEMNGLLRAIAIISGRLETIFEHTKGPAEILAPAAFGLLVERFEPFAARLPFALAYVLAVSSFYLLAQNLFKRGTALFASLLLAINGLYLTFGRLVQYQALVFLMTNISILLAYRFYQKGDRRSLWMSGLAVGAGLLGHYDALMALPPISYLVWRRYGKERAAWTRDWPHLLGAGATLFVIGAIFYIPFLLNPNIAATSNYLERVIGPEKWPSNNFDELYRFTVMANSVYYAAFVAFLGFAAILFDLANAWRTNRRNVRFWVFIGIAVSFCLLAILTGNESFLPLFVCTLVLVLLNLFFNTTSELKTVYIWISVPFIVYIFFIDHPRNHIQNIYPGWSLLAAVTGIKLANIFRRKAAFLSGRWGTIWVTAGLGLLFMLFAGYQYLLYLDVNREYVFTYPAHKSSFYWEDPDFPFGSRRLHGAPHRLGWQMINKLYLQDYFSDDWDSNDDGSNLFWYTLGSPRNPCYPRFYFLTQFEQQDDNSEDAADSPSIDYVKIGEVWNRDRLQIDVYEFAPLDSVDSISIWTEPPRYSSYVMPTDFVSWPYTEAAVDISQPLSPPPTFKPSPIALQQVADVYDDPRILEVHDKVTLIGYDLDDRRARPGGLVVLTLYWQAVDIVNVPYKIFTHLESVPIGTTPPRLWSQADDFPVCGTGSTQHWAVGDTVMDQHLLRLPEDIPPGEYVLRVGLYEPKTGMRMDLLDSLENPQGTSFELVQLVIE